MKVLSIIAGIILLLAAISVLPNQWKKARLQFEYVKFCKRLSSVGAGDYVTLAISQEKSYLLERAYNDKLILSADEKNIISTEVYANLCSAISNAEGCTKDYLAAVWNEHCTKLLEFALNTALSYGLSAHDFCNLTDRVYCSNKVLEDCIGSLGRSGITVREWENKCSSVLHSELLQEHLQELLEKASSENVLSNRVAAILFPGDAEPRLYDTYMSPVAALSIPIGNYEMFPHVELYLSEMLASFYSSNFDPEDALSAEEFETVCHCVSDTPELRRKAKDISRGVINAMSGEGKLVRIGNSENGNEAYISSELINKLKTWFVQKQGAATLPQLSEKITTQLQRDGALRRKAWIAQSVIESLVDADVLKTVDIEGPNGNGQKQILYVCKHPAPGQALKRRVISLD